VRAAVIAVLLSHPEYAEGIPSAQERLDPAKCVTLQSFYVAAVLLQQEHAHRLRRFVGSRWRWLPELEPVTTAWSLPSKVTPGEKLAALGREYQRRAQETMNWRGAYEQVASQLLRQWESESRWNQ
jgi:hypothetical protein